MKDKSEKIGDLRRFTGDILKKFKDGKLVTANPNVLKKVVDILDARFNDMVNKEALNKNANAYREAKNALRTVRKEAYDNIENEFNSLRNPNLIYNNHSIINEVSRQIYYKQFELTCEALKDEFTDKDTREKEAGFRIISGYAQELSDEEKNKIKSEILKTAELDIDVKRYDAIIAYLNESNRDKKNERLENLLSDEMSKLQKKYQNELNELKANGVKNGRRKNDDVILSIKAFAAKLLANYLINKSESYEQVVNELNEKYNEMTGVIPVNPEIPEEQSL